MFGALLKKEFRSLVRNRMLFTMLMLYPIVVLLGLPWATNMDINNLRLVIVSPETNSTVRLLSDKIYRSGYFTPVAQASAFPTPQEAMELMARGKTDLILTLGNNFEEELVRTGRATVEVKTNATNAMKAVVGPAYTQQIVQTFIEETARARGIDPALAMPVSVSETLLFNPTGNYKSFILPGLLAILLCLIAFVLPTLSVVEEKESGTIEQMNVSPVSPTLFILSKILPYVLIAQLMALISVPIMEWVYGIRFQGNLGVLMLGSLLFSFALGGIGLIISSAAKTQQQAMFMCVFVQMFLLLLSGIFTPTAGMPLWARVISYSEPVTHYAYMARVLTLKGGGFEAVASQLIILTAFAVVLMFIARMVYRKRA